MSEAPLLLTPFAKLIAVFALQQPRVSEVACFSEMQEEQDSRLEIAEFSIRGLRHATMSECWTAKIGMLLKDTLGLVPRVANRKNQDEINLNTIRIIPLLPLAHA